MKYSVSPVSYDCVLPVSDANLQWGVYLTAMGYDLLRPGETCNYETRPLLYKLEYEKGRVLPEYLLFHVNDGCGEFNSDATGELAIPDGAFVFICPGCWHTYRPCQKLGWRDVWITFNGPLVQTYQARGIVSPERPIILLPESAHEKAVKQLSELVAKIEQTPTINDPAYAGDIIALLTTVFPAQDSEARYLIPNLNDDVERTIRQAQKIIWSWGHREIDVDFVAQKVGKNRRTLERYFRDRLDCSIRDQIHRARIHRACELLTQTGMKIDRIAQAAGFPNTTQMYRVFERVIHKTPCQVRDNKE